jgi:diguanylate cyclase (GGDEF)-like protein
MNEVFKRSSDYSYRVGGEEFLIVSESQDEKNSLLMVENLRKEVKMLNIEHKENENYGVLTVSIGVCTQQVTNITTIDELFSKADNALYKSKNNGRNKVTLY